MSSISSVAQSGPAAWIENQFVTPSLETHWTYVMERKGPPGCKPCISNTVGGVMESFWRQAVLGPDQLRQRLAFALGEIFVVSTVNSPAIGPAPDAHASYLDMLSRNAFGNFRTLMEQVATHPTMGKYLSHMGNMKEDPGTGRLPDENFARELMQLFTVGLWELNPDGSRKRDANGQDIPTYSQADVMGLAKVFTGWGWGNGKWSNGFLNAPGGYIYARDWNHQMINYPEYHSTSEKNIIRGVIIPAGSSGDQSLKIALDTLFNHPNVGPFIGSQLIKRFITSNPSPAYVSRVTAAFNNNGQGVRGDMKAVIKAVLLDSEARDTSKLSDPLWGKLREPIVRYANFLRAFDVKSASGKYPITNLEDPVRSLGQNPQKAPSVFNWFTPTYSPPGDISNKGLVAPEFSITDETTTTGYANFIVNKAERETNWWKNNVINNPASTTDYLGADYTAEMLLASTPVALVDRLNLLLAAGRMSGATRQAIIDAISTVPASKNSGFNRVAGAVALTMVSPEFIVQK
jgi:uncharacterized protein (DUF1800 family)